MIRHAHLVAGLAWLALVTASLAQPPAPTLELTQEQTPERTPTATLPGWI